MVSTNTVRLMSSEITLISLSIWCRLRFVLSTFERVRHGDSTLFDFLLILIVNVLCVLGIYIAVYPVILAIAVSLTDF